MRQDHVRDAGDVMHRLRAANPVLDCQTPPIEEVWRRIDLDYDDASASRRVVRRRRWFALPPFALAAVLAAVAVVALGGNGRTTPSIVAQAVAATDSPNAIVHYIAVSTARPASGRLSVVHSNSAIWVSGTSTHIISTGNVAYARAVRPFAACELAVSKGRVAIYNRHVRAIYLSRVPGSSSGKGLTALRTLAAEVARARAKECAPAAATLVPGAVRLLPVDPLAVVRSLYAIRALRSKGQLTLDGRRVDVIVEPGRLERYTLYVDPRTFEPVQSETRLYGPKGKLLLSAVTKYTVYQRIALNPRTLALLALAPHPGVPVRNGIPLRAIPLPAPPGAALRVALNRVARARAFARAFANGKPSRVAIAPALRIAKAHALRVTRVLRAAARRLLQARRAAFAQRSRGAPRQASARRTPDAVATRGVPTRCAAR